jgi:hypothetical protein
MKKTNLLTMTIMALPKIINMENVSWLRKMGSQIADAICEPIVFIYNYFTICWLIQIAK